MRTKPSRYRRLVRPCGGLVVALAEQTSKKEKVGGTSADQVYLDTRDALRRFMDTSDPKSRMRREHLSTYNWNTRFVRVTPGEREGVPLSCTAAMCATSIIRITVCYLVFPCVAVHLSHTVLYPALLPHISACITS